MEVAKSTGKMHRMPANCVFMHTMYAKGLGRKERDWCIDFSEL